VAFWGLVITAVVLAVRYLAGGGSHHNSVGGGSGPAGSRAEDVLAERYARGEIDDDEYRRRLTLIREHR
jgi:putative membrane protein